MAAALLTGFFMTRMMAIKVEDRLIRLRERLRFEPLFAAGLRPRIEESTTEQLVALRCASDRALPELLGKVLNEKWNDRKAIRRLVKTWRPDYARAQVRKNVGGGTEELVPLEPS